MKCTGVDKCKYYIIAERHEECVHVGEDDRCHHDGARLDYLEECVLSLNDVLRSLIIKELKK